MDTESEQCKYFPLLKIGPKSQQPVNNPSVEEVFDVKKSSQSDLNRFQRREMWNIYVGSDIVAFGAF